jgi:soluble lytic murein transglycosylase-like protein/TolA-binding protein
MFSSFVSIVGLVTLLTPLQQPPAQGAYATGKHLFHQGSYEAAVVQLGAAIHADPDTRVLRNATHLLARAQAGIGDHAKAIETFTLAIKTTEQPGFSSLVDVLRYERAKSLIAVGNHQDAVNDLKMVVDDSHSARRRQAAHLIAQTYEAMGNTTKAIRAYDHFLRRWSDSTNARDCWLRIALLEHKARNTQRSIRILKRLVRQTPLSRAGKRAHAELKAWAKSGVSAARTDTPMWRINSVEWFMSDRRFRDALPLATTHLNWAEKKKSRHEKIRALGWLARIYEQIRQEKKSIQILKRLSQLTGIKPTLRKLMRLTALSGDYAAAEKLFKARHQGRKNRYYWHKLADFRYQYGQYRAAYEAYINGQSKKARRKNKIRLNKKMAWCLIAMGESERAIPFFSSRASRIRKLRERMSMHYWHGRALQVADRKNEALAIFDKLSTRWPRKYYGILAHSRALEMRGKAPGQRKPVSVAELASAFSALPDKPPTSMADLDSSIFWGAGPNDTPYNHAPRPSEETTQLDALKSLATEWGEWVPEAHRALELAQMGFHSEARIELRIIEGDIRAVRRRGAGGVIRRTRSGILDNRSIKKAPAGASMHDAGRRNRKEAWAFAKRAKQIRKSLRKALIAYGDYYGIRHAALKSYRKHRTSAAKSATMKLKQAYPMAYPKLVQPNALKNAVPPYFLYSIMTVESTFHPHPVSVANAYGLLQVIPRTGRRIASEIKFNEFSPELLLRPEVSITFGSYYLGKLLEKFSGQELLAAAAYNGGPHRVEAWIRANPNRPMDLFVDNIPYGQSRGYARSVLEKVAIYHKAHHNQERIYVSNVLKPACRTLPNY